MRMVMWNLLIAPSVECRLTFLLGEFSKLRRMKSKTPDFHIVTEFGKQSFPFSCDVGRSHTPVRSD